MSKRVEYFVIGTVFGATAGFLAGLLIAPSSGAETRRKLAEEATKAAHAARTLAARAEEAAEYIGGQVGHYLGRDEEVAWKRIEEIRAGLDGYTQTQH